MTRLKHEFVEFIPKELEEGVIYISIRFCTVVHNCACGCGNRTVTPLSKTDWKLSFDGSSISLSPSIGNWNFPCQSHYWIRNNYVEWDRNWSKEEIDKGRENARHEKEIYYHQLEKDLDEPNAKDLAEHWWSFKWLFGKK